MRREHLLHLYPRRWRERYGEEFLATLGDGALHWQQIIDIVFGAIDARLSADVRRATIASRLATNRGAPMTLKSLMVCDRKQMGYTPRDSLIGAGVMIAATLLLTMMGSAVKRGGWATAGEVLTNFSFLAALMLSTPFWLTKGQPWKAQIVIVGGTLVVLVAIGYLATVS